MYPARRVNESEAMRASRSARTSARRARSARKSAARLTKKVIKVVPRPAPAPPEQVLFRFCKAGWAVIVEKLPNAQGTRFVCPFCPLSHRVQGPVRGFRKVRRAQWIKLRRVEE